MISCPVKAYLTRLYRVCGVSVDCVVVLLSLILVLYNNDIYNIKIRICWCTVCHQCPNLHILLVGC